MVRGRPGVAPQTEKREHFARLIARGVPNAEACRVVGINRRTGKRWRHGRTVISRGGRLLHYPPVITSRKTEISKRYLSEDERVRIAGSASAGSYGAGDRGRGGPQSVDGEAGASPQP